MSNIQPVFIVGTGRSGSRSIFRMLSGSENLEIHHEYCCTHIQKYSALYHMGLISEEEIINQMTQQKQRMYILFTIGLYLDLASMVWVLCIF